MRIVRMQGAVQNHTAGMPLSSWLRSWTANQPPQKSDSAMVCESLLMELDFQMQEADALEYDRQVEARREKAGGVDYQWLASDRPKPHEMPQLERLELGELCLKVKPEECGRVITQFRDHLAVRTLPALEIPRVLRAVILNLLEGRPKEETMPEWMMRSFSSLAKMRSNSSVAPLNEEKDLTGCSSLHLAGCSSSQSDNKVYTISSLDDLPV